METTLDQAAAVAWRVGVEAGLLRELRSELKSMREVDKMLRLIFLGASGAVNTWRAAVRAVERLERWSFAHGLSRDEWTGVRLSIFLSDAGHSCYSVPTSVRCGLKLMSDSLMLAWPLERPLVMAVCRTSSRSAQAQRSLAEAKKLPCLSVEQLQHLEFVGCSTKVLLAIRWAAASNLAKLACSVSVGGRSGNALGFRLPPCGLPSASIHGLMRCVICCPDLLWSIPSSWTM